MKKVLIYTPTVGRGGVKRVVEKLSQSLAKVANPQDWAFDVLGQTYDEIGGMVEYPKSWAFTQLEPGEKIPAHPHQFEYLYQHREVFYAHLKKVSANYDLIYNFSPWWTMRSKEWDLPVPFVTTVPDFAFDMIDMGLLSFNFRHVAKMIAQRASFVTFPSNFQREWGEKYYGFKQTRTIHHSADFVADNFDATAEEAERVREKYGLPKQYSLAFHPMYHKGVLTVLQAWSEYPLENLVVAGIGTEHILSDKPVDNHIDLVRTALKTTGHEPGKTFFALGRIPEEDIAGLYVGATCAICMSESDGDLSGSIFEAMMASCPLICSDLPVFTERLTGKHCLFAPVKDAKTLAERINQIINDPESARQRALEAFGYANSRTAADVANEYLQIFREVL